MEGSHGALEEGFQFEGHVGGQVLELRREPGQTLGLGRRSHRDAQVSLELECRAERVPFDDVRLNRDGCPTELVEQGARPGMICVVTLRKGEDSDFVGLLPRKERTILVHNLIWCCSS